MQNKGTSGSAPGRKKKRSLGPRHIIGSTKGEAARLAVLCVAASVLLSIVIIPPLSDYFGLNQQDLQAQITVAEDESNASVIKNLKKSGIINHPTIFKMYLALSGSNYSFKPGTYLLNANFSYDEIAIAMRNVKIQSSIVKITFPEGLTQNDIANMLEKEKVCTAAAFHRYLGTLDPSELKYDFANLIPEDYDVFRPYEGFLFPDTYEFFVGENPATAADRFFSRFDEVVTEDLRTLMKERNMTLVETLTMASIIEKESSLTEEAPNVSSVLHNRLADRATFPRLQCDVTVFYVNDNIKPFIETKDQDLYDSYNTYVREGLPIGPICSPGLSSIKAALTPAVTDYYFFITDAEGKFYFAKTFEDHLVNIKNASGKTQGISTPQSEDR